MFTTRTGQTGRAAYLFEAAAIANEQRELDARMKRLLEAAHAEHPELFACSSDYDPRLGDGRGGNAAKFVEYLQQRQERTA